MTALTPDTQPGDHFNLEGRVLLAHSGKWWKHPALTVKCQVTIDGDTRWAEVRIMDAGESPARWFNKAEDVVATLDAPAEPERKPESDNVTALTPTDVDNLTVRQLRETAANLGVELPAKAKRPELVALLKSAIAEQQAA